MNKFFAALLIGLSFVACTPKSAAPAVDGQDADATAKTAKDFASSKAQIDSVSYLLGIQLGSFMKSYNFGSDMNYAEITKGIKDFLNANGKPQDPEFGKQFKVDPNDLTSVFNTYLEKRHNLVALQNKAKSDAFLAENAKKDGIQQTPSGLQYKIINAGNENHPTPADTVWVKYKGTLIDGTVFDETPADAEPINFTLNRVIPGWSEGMQLIGEGGKIQLFIPSDLGYGDRGAQTIEPNSALVFDVELVKVGKVAAE